jgi:hypothetical protein
MIAGALFLAVANKSRTRAAPIPTSISINSEPAMEKNGTLASPATAFARRVFPDPAGPMSMTPFGWFMNFLTRMAGKGSCYFLQSVVLF